MASTPHGVAICQSESSVKTWEGPWVSDGVEISSGEIGCKEMVGGVGGGGGSRGGTPIGGGDEVQSQGRGARPARGRALDQER